MFIIFSLYLRPALFLQLQDLESLQFRPSTITERSVQMVCSSGTAEYVRIVHQDLIFRPLFIDATGARRPDLSLLVEWVGIYAKSHTIFQTLLPSSHSRIFRSLVSLMAALTKSRSWLRSKPSRIQAKAVNPESGEYSLLDGSALKKGLISCVALRRVLMLSS